MLTLLEPKLLNIFDFAGFITSRENENNESLNNEKESEIDEFEPCLKNRFQLSIGLNLETLNTFLSGTNSSQTSRSKV